MRKLICYLGCNVGQKERNVLVNYLNVKTGRFLSTKPSLEPDEEFRTLDLKRSSDGGVSRRRRLDKKAEVKVNRGRADAMSTDQDWTSVWPAPRTFHPAVVPLPIRQGINKLGASPSKFGNAELMKIPNFLHLTPPAVDKQTEALKQFCTAWPEALHNDEECQRHFPLEVTMTDYCHSSPSIRDPLARIVTIKFPLSRLELDSHARDKLLRLIGDRYDADTDTVTIVTDKCPLKQQNYEYALYLLTAVYHESWRIEDWEKEKIDADMECYEWENSASRRNVERTMAESNRSLSMSDPVVQNYANAVVSVFDEGENDYNWEKYQEASVKLLFAD